MECKCKVEGASIVEFCALHSIEMHRAVSTMLIEREHRERVALALLPSVIERAPEGSMFRQHAMKALELADVFIDECGQPRQESAS